jgi:hypothetical protein
MMMSAAFAVTVSARRRGSRLGVIGFGLVTVIFVYAFVDNVIEKPDGIVISLAFIAGIVLISLVSRLARATELRADASSSTRRRSDDRRGDARRHLHLIANKIQAGDGASTATRRPSSGR